MDQAWDKAHGPWPSTADILVRELSWQGPHNPCPKSKDPGSHGEQLVEEYLSPARLVSAKGLGAQAAGLRVGQHPRAGVRPALGPQPSRLAWLTDVLSPAM